MRSDFYLHTHGDQSNQIPSSLNRRSAAGSTSARLLNPMLHHV
jgi:hypothetical protein